MEKFNTLYKDFLNFLLKNVSNYKKQINSVFNNEEKYLTYFVEFNIPYFEDISTRNQEIFLYKHTDAQLIRDLKFKKVIEYLKNSNKKNILENIWQYLHKLYIVSYNSCDLKHFVKKNYPSLSNIIKNHDIYIENIMMSNTNMNNSHKNSNNDGTEGTEGTEYSDGTDGTECTDDSESEDSESEEEKELRAEFEKKIRSTSKSKSKSKKDTKKIKKIDSKDTKDEDDDNEDVVADEDDDENKEKEDLFDMEKMFDGTLIGNLAKEMADNLDLDKKDFENIENPSDVMKLLFASNENGENKLQKIMKEVGGKMEEKMRNGEINKEQLLQEVLKAGGKMGNLGEMFKGLNGEGGNPDLSKMMNSMMNGMMNGGGNKKSKHKSHKKHRRPHKK